MEEATTYGPLVHVTGRGLEKQKEAIAANLRESGVPWSNMAVIEPSLEDVFIECMRA